MQRTVLLELADLRSPILGLPEFLLEDLLAAVAGAVALGLGTEQIRASLRFDEGGVAAFALPPTGDRVGEGLLVVTPARNSSALAAWGRHFQEHFPGRPAHLLFEPSDDWRTLDAPLLADLLVECFPSITIALNSHMRSFVEAVEMAHPRRLDRPVGQSSDLLGSLDELLAGRGTADLVCVCPPNAAGFLTVLRHLETKGLSRQGVGGLASVRHCR
jgi:hypothetical protein